MSIDWFTFTAQIVNFLILVGLMKKFLYGPIIRVMDQREAGITARIEAADSAKALAEQRGVDYQEKLDELAGTRDELVAETARDVEVWRTEQLRHAKTEVESARHEWNCGLVREKQAMIRDLQQHAARHSTELSRHILRHLANADLQDRIVDVFMGRLEEMDTETRKRFATGTTADRPLIVETVVPLRDADRAKIKAVVDALIDHDAEVAFRTNPDLICGIELKSTGCRLGWSAREPLAELETDFIDAINDSIPDIEPLANHQHATVSGSSENRGLAPSG